MTSDLLLGIGIVETYGIALCLLKNSFKCLMCHWVVTSFSHALAVTQQNCINIRWNTNITFTVLLGIVETYVIALCSLNNSFKCLMCYWVATSSSHALAVRQQNCINITWKENTTFTTWYRHLPPSLLDHWHHGFLGRHNPALRACLCYLTINEAWNPT